MFSWGFAGPHCWLKEIPTSNNIKVLIADDHPLVRTILARILEGEPDIVVVSTAKGGDQAVEKTQQLKPDIILMDVSMPRCSSLESILSIKERSPSVRILMMALSEWDESLFQAFRMGAQGYLLKSASVKELIDAVRKIGAGEAIISRGLIMRLAKEFKSKLREWPELSPMEREILRLIEQGFAPAEISRRIPISESELMSNICGFLKKFQESNRRGNAYNDSSNYAKFI